MSNPFALPLFNWHIILDRFEIVRENGEKSFTDEEDVFIFDYHQKGNESGMFFRLISGGYKEAVGELDFKIHSCKELTVCTEGDDDQIDPLSFAIHCDGHEVFKTKSFKLFSAQKDISVEEEPDLSVKKVLL
jgi:hypothetical protein